MEENSSFNIELDHRNLQESESEEEEEPTAPGKYINPLYNLMKETLECLSSTPELYENRLIVVQENAIISDEGH